MPIRRRRYAALVAAALTAAFVAAISAVGAVAQDEGPPRVFVDMSDSPDPVYSGQNLDYKIVVENQGPGQSDFVHLSDVLPTEPAPPPVWRQPQEGIELLSFSTTQGSCREGTFPISEVATAELPTVECELGPLAERAHATVSIRIRVTMTRGIVENFAYLGNSDADFGDGLNPCHICQDGEQTTVYPPPSCKGDPATIVGTNGPDARTGSQGRDVFVSLGGSDKLSGKAGNDLVCGGGGKDTLKGGKGKDSLLGQKGKDTLGGGKGKDICRGGKGNDTASKCEVEKSI